MIPLYLRQPNKGLKMGKKFWPTFRRWGRNIGSRELQGGTLVQNETRYTQNCAKNNDPGAYIYPKFAPI